jgi:membrane fusion protein
MSSNLFRKEVLGAQRDEWLGSIRLQAPHLGWTFFGIGIFAVVALLSLLIGGHYTRREKVAGTLVPSMGLLNLTPLTPGTITRVLVHEGDTVQAGQALLEVSGTQDSASLGNTQAAVEAQLQKKRSLLLADLDGLEHLTQLQQQDLHERLSMLQQQMDQAEQQLALQQQRADSATALYEQWAKAAVSGAVSKAQVLQQHDSALQDLAQAKELKGQVLQLKQQSEQVQEQLDQLPTTATNKRNDTERQLSDVMQSIAENAAQTAVIVRAPASGMVANLLVHTGQAVAAQQPMMTLLPTGSTLLAELWVPTRAIGFIHQGEPVVLRYRAYPYQKFGQHFGRVVEVSRSAVLPSEVSRLIGEDAKEPRYRVEVQLDNQQILAYGKKEALKPGMALDADVLLDRRRLIEWVLEPLYGYAHEMHDHAPEQEEVN